MMLRCLYSCDGCGVTDADFDVPERRSDEDVIAWMEKLRQRVTIEHRFRSPDCQATALAEVKIPMTGAQRIGGLPIH